MYKQLNTYKHTTSHTLSLSLLLFGLFNVLLFFLKFKRLNGSLTRFLIPYRSWARIFRRLFTKRCIFGSKSGTKKSSVRRHLAEFAKTVPELLKFCHIWLIKLFKKCLVIFLIHIIQLFIFSSEYTEKRQLSTYQRFSAPF